MSDHHDSHLETTSESVDARAPVTKPTSDQAQRQRSRRRWIKAAVMAVPVVLTLRGRPAQADTILASGGRDPAFFLTGHGLSHKNDPPGPPGETQTTNFLNSNQNTRRWSEGSSWDGGEESSASSDSGTSP
jgi:hypothetical protein